MEKRRWRVGVVERDLRLYLRARDRETRQSREKVTAAGTGRREASKLARDWEAELNATAVSLTRLRLSEAVELFESQKLVHLRPRSATRYRTACNRFVKDVGDPDIVKVNEMAVSGALARYGKDHAPAGVVAYARHIKAFLRWLTEMGLLRSVNVKIPKIDEAETKQGVSGEAFERVLAKVASVRPGDAEGWKRALLLCRYAGFRIQETTRLHWGEGPIAAVRTGTGTGWAFRFAGVGQKSRKTETVPAVPQMARLLDSWSVDGESGRVCRVGVRAEGSQRGSAIGAKFFREAGVVGGPHALRRAFLQEWSTRLAASDLMKLARHSSIATTLKFYIGQEAAGLSDRLVSAVGGDSRPGFGEFSGEFATECESPETTQPATK